MENVFRCWSCSIVSGANGQQQSAMMPSASVNEEVSLAAQQQAYKGYTLAEESVALSMASGDLCQQEVDCQEERIMNASAPSSSMGIPVQVLSQTPSLVYADPDNSYSVSKEMGTKSYMSEQTNVCKVCLMYCLCPVNPRLSYGALTGQHFGVPSVM